MKVTMVNAEKLPVPPVLGGAISHTLYETVKALQWPEFSTISPWADELKHVEDTYNGPFHHVDIDKQENYIRNLLKKDFPAKLNDPALIHYFSYLQGVAQELDALNPDIIQVHNRLKFVPFLANRFPHKSIVLSMHNEPDQEDRCCGHIIPKIRHFLFVSKYLEQKFVEEFPRSRGRTTVIHNGIDFDKWHPDLKKSRKTKTIQQRYKLLPERTVLFVGRTSPVKGIHHLLQAIQILKKRLPDVKLVIVGSPFFGALHRDPFLEYLEKQASQMQDTIIFTGYQDRAQTPYFYAAADLTVVPSVFADPLPKVVLESMTSGVPVVASRRGGIPEMIDHGQNGLLFDDPADVQTLADHIFQILTNKEQRDKMGISARNKALSHFTPNTRFNRLRHFYRFLERGDGQNLYFFSRRRIKTQQYKKGKNNGKKTNHKSRYVKRS